MEGCCLDFFIKQGNISSFYDNGGGGVHQSSDTMLCSLAPPQLGPIADNQKMMCGCAICNTSKYIKESLNAWWRKQLKTVKDKAENSRGRGKYEFNSRLKIIF